MHSAAMRVSSKQREPTESIVEESRPVGRASSRITLSHLRSQLECKQAAAVCYRMRNRGIEFLLVKTRAGRWTFPKGCAEPGLTHAQAAALEAFEEAGVHGRIEETAFTRYARPVGARQSGSSTVTVSAHLCEVSRLDPPQESNRNRTWFTAALTKQRLCEARTPTSGAELVRVVTLAVDRIEDLHQAIRIPTQRQLRPLPRVQSIDTARVKTQRRSLL